LGDVNTQLNGIPLSSSGQARESEFYGSGRQSRLALLVQGKTGSMALTGYYEMDFLSAGITSNNNQSNSYTMRQRQAWGQAALNNGWTFTAGQMWSLVTETRKGLDNRTEALPLTIDPQYVVGFSWARQYGFRVTKNLNNKIWAGISVENSQELLTASNANANFLMGGPGNCGGLYNCGATVGGYTTLVNGITTTTDTIGGIPVVTGVTPTTAVIVNPGATNYSSNLTPDFIGKLAFEPGFGHYEVFVVGSLFRDRIYPNFATKSAAGAFNDETYGFGFGANARWLLANKHVEPALHFLGGNGVGRYGSSTLPDLTVDGSGYLHPLRTYQGNAELDLHTTKWDWYFDVGGEYVNNWSRPEANGTLVGYGLLTANNSGCGTETLPVAPSGFAPGALASCAGQTRALLEGSGGFWYKPYNGPKGRLQMGMQYSYLARQTWAGTNNFKTGSISPTAIDNMVFTSFRYYLP
jgi:hypothetical protein